MRRILLCGLLALNACASDEYSKMPEATGPWLPVNPPGLMADSAPLPAPTAAPIRLSSVARGHR